MGDFIFRILLSTIVGVSASKLNTRERYRLWCESKGLNYFGQMGLLFTGLTAVMVLIFVIGYWDKLFPG